MRRTIILLCIIAFFAMPALAREKGHISVTAKVSIYDPPGDAKIAPMFTLEARYRLSAFLAIVGSGSWSNYESGDADVTYIPVAVDGELHFLGRSTLDPYTGAGLSVNYRSYNYEGSENDDTDLTIGAELLGGITYKPQHQFGFELDFKYRIEDLAHIDESGSWSLGGGVTGSWEKDL